MSLDGNKPSLRAWFLFFLTLLLLFISLPWAEQGDPKSHKRKKKSGMHKSKGIFVSGTKPL